MKPIPIPDGYKFQKGNQFGKLNKGRKRPDLAERNRRGMSLETRKKLSESKKGKGFVFRPEHFCPYCKSIHIISSYKCWRCGDCGKHWMKNPIGREHLKSFNPDVQCPKCNSHRIGNNYDDNHDEYFHCHDCGKQWAKNPRRKQEGWQSWNKGKSKVQISIEEFNDLYFNQQLSQSQIAEKLGVSQTGIGLFMEKYRLKARPQHIWINRDPNKQRLINQKIGKALKGNINWRFSHKFPNKEEEKLIYFFERWNLPFKYVGDGSFKIDGKCPDFINEKKKLIIEYFGELWHDSNDEPNRVKFFESHGWNCLVIWGKEVGWWS